MASPKLPGLLLVVLAVAACVSSASAVGDHYCRDSLSGLLTCHNFMFEGAPAASLGCCAAYGVAFDANPFCLCYIANGVYGRSTGYDVNVTRALEIPLSCGQVAPPIELCGMQGLVLPPYEPESPAVAPPPLRPAQAPEASSLTTQPSSAGSLEPPPSSPAAPSSTFPSPPPPTRTSGGGRDLSVQMALMFFTVAAGLVAAVA